MWLNSELNSVAGIPFSTAGPKCLNSRHSRAALGALAKQTVAAKTVWECHLALQSLAGQTSNITLGWIKAHVGHLGNERADDRAKEGARARPDKSNL